jgi:predicted metal-dependent peptidase
MRGPDLDVNRLAAAKLWLITDRSAATGAGCGDMPYLSAALYSLSTVASAEVSTMAVDDRWRLYVNAAWLARTEVKEIAFELSHLLWHLLHDHAGRARSLAVGPAGSNSWGLATDACIAELLSAEPYGHGHLSTPAELDLKAGHSAEEYFATLHRLTVDDVRGATKPGDKLATCGSAVDGLPRWYELPADADCGDVGEVQATALRRQVAIAFQEHMSGRTTTPGEWARWVERILEPTVPWQQVLAASVRRSVGWASGRADYTYGRMSRRQGAFPRIVLPGMTRPVPNVAVVIDTSGSVDDTLLSQALGEVDGALTAVGVAGSHISVLACDAAVQAVSRVRSARDVTLGGGGGTDLRVGIDSACRLKPRADVIIVLTDGYTPWPERQPAVAVIAGVLGRRGWPLPPTPSWTTRVECLLSG